jgi:hypothetical protein
MTEGVEMIRLPSRALSTVGYDADSKILRVRFRHGGLYDYFDVPRDVFDGLCGSEHPWTEWGPRVTSSYRYRRLE